MSSSSFIPVFVCVEEEGLVIGWVLHAPVCVVCYARLCVLCVTRACVCCALHAPVCCAPVSIMKSKEKSKRTPTDVSSQFMWRINPYCG